MDTAALKKITEEIGNDYLFYFSRLLNRVMVVPDMMQIMLTSKCNLRCKICDVWKQRFDTELTTAELKLLIDQAIEMGIKTIYFTGGEALLRNDIFELINYAARPGVITTINTNGSLITEDVAKKIVSTRLRNITFSIDSATPEIHNAIRGKDVFEKAMDAIRYLNYYKKTMGRDSKVDETKKLDVGMASVIMKPNMRELRKIAELAEKMLCCYIAFQPLIFNGNLLENASYNSDYFIAKEDIGFLEEALRDLELLKKEKLPQGFYIDFMAEKTIQHFLRQRTVNTCFAGFTRIFISPQGDIGFVCFESFGNVRLKSLQSAWISDEACAIRAKIKQCKVNCTQFCSERPESESFQDIYNRTIKNKNLFFEELLLSFETVALTLNQEGVQVKCGGNDFLKAAQDLEEISSFIKQEISLKGHFGP